MKKDSEPRLIVSPQFLRDWQENPPHWTSLRYLAICLLVAVVYTVGGKLALMLAFLHPSASPVWPPTGIAFSALLLLGYRVWPAVFAGAFVVNLTTAGTVATSVGIALGNTAEGLLGAYLVNRFASGLRVFDRPQTIIRFAVLAGLLSTALSATVGVTTLALGGFAAWAGFGSIWLTWWLGNAAGNLIVAPVLVPLWIANRIPRWDRFLALEAMALTGGLVLSTWIAFGPLASIDSAIKYLCIPFLFWAAFRFSQWESAMAVLLLAAVGITSLLYSHVFQGQAIANASLLVVEGFIGVMSVMTLSVAAVVAERKRAEQALRRDRDNLEGRVASDALQLAVAGVQVRQTEAILARAQQIAHTGSFRWDAVANRVTWSDELHRIYGVAPAEFTGSFEAFLAYVHPDDRAEVQAAIQRAVQEGQPFRMRERIIRPDGEVRTLNSIGEVVLDLSGQVVELMGVCRDITEEERAEQALANLAAIVESSDDAIISEDFSGVIKTWNQGAERLFGYSAAEVIGRSVSILFPVDRQMEAAQIQERIQRGERLEHYETVRLTKDGRLVDVSVQYSPLRDSKGEVIGSSRIVRDISERRAAEAQVRRSAVLLARAEQIARTGSFHRDLIRNHVTWSDEMCRIWGRKPPADGSGFDGVLSHVHPDDRAEAKAVFTRALQDGQPFQFRSRILRPDGEVRVIGTIGEPARDATGRVVEIQGACRDITEEVKAEGVLQDMAGKLISAQEEERSRIGRELHDHLTQRAGLLAIKLDELRTDPSICDVAFFDRLTELSNHVNSLTNDIHSLSHRLHSSTLEYLGLVPALENLVAEFSRLADFRIEVSLDPLQARLPADLALCLFRIAEESLNNCAAHSRVKAARLTLAANEQGIRLTVEDMGVGFDPATLNGRSGLGLISMRERLRLVQGSIRIGSAPGRGTRIEAWIPSRSLLLVEDNPGDAALLRRMVSVMGEYFRVTHVTCLAQGLECLRKGGVDAVLLDLGLPDSQGLDTLTRVRAQAPHVPIIVISGQSDRETARLALSQGAQGFIAKEQAEEQLLQQLGRTILSEIGRAPDEQTVQRAEAEVGTA